jgi:hypothetical protein
LSDPSPAPDLNALRERVLNLYAVVTLLMFVGIAVLVVYVLLLGPLTSPGAEESFGLAICLMALMGAVIAHLVDRTYRSWPLGRTIAPTPPGYVSVQSQANFVRVAILVAAVAAIAYLIAGLLT